MTRAKQPVSDVISVHVHARLCLCAFFDPPHPTASMPQLKVQCVIFAGIYDFCIDKSLTYSLKKCIAVQYFSFTTNRKNVKYCVYIFMYKRNMHVSGKYTHQLQGESGVQVWVRRPPISLANSRGGGRVTLQFKVSPL